MQPPNAPTASLNHARQAYAAGRVQEALDICTQVLAASRANFDAKLLLGSLEIQVGRHTEGIAHLQEVLDEVPGIYEAVLWMSVGYRNIGENRKALDVAMRAHDIRPDDAQAFNIIGEAQLALGLLADAELSFRNATKIKPSEPMYFVNLGRTCLLRFRMDHAAEAFDCAAAAAANSLGACMAVGAKLFELRQLSSAEYCGRRAVELRPSDAAARTFWAKTLMAVGRNDEARTQLEEAMVREPDHPEPPALIGTLLQSAGQDVEAAEFFRCSISVRPVQGSAYLSLVQSIKVTRKDLALVHAMEKASADTGLPESELEALHYALGKAHEDLGQFEPAMRDYDAANAIAYRRKIPAGGMDLAKFAEGIDWTISFFTKDLFARRNGSGDPTERPIFIVGMVRTGTTLMEQILSCHSQVYGAGEVEFWASEGMGCFDVAKNALHEDVLVDATARYLRLLERLAPEAGRIVDKMPANILALGLIHLALPNARIILMRRNKLDNCVSIYCTPNNAVAPFFHNKRNIGFAYREYAKLADHWRAVLPPDRLKVIDYEDLVWRSGAVISDTLSFCGLPWEDACLLPQRNMRTVITPSASQVRQAIHTGSVDRWRRFAAWAKDFGE